ncbi:hypothetical protein AB1L30_02890 [Bremerella sp. JC817]|uniref:hypothetical protein n=1 Tax=Bremerella sp. JC817 TaxID=3231756 RepID=UPI00345A6E63
MLAIIQAAIHDLPRIRSDQKEWHRFQYRESKTEAGEFCDANDSARYLILTALQFAATDEDESLVRYLLQQEIQLLENDPYQGYGDKVRLASYLLMRWHRLDDFWLYADAKSANFDTACGYDSQFLAIHGPEAATARLASREHHAGQWLKEVLFDEEGTFRWNASEMEAWQAALADYFPRDPEAVSIRGWIELAIDLQQLAEAKVLLERYRLETEEIDFYWLVFTQKQLGDLPGALSTYRQMLAAADTNWDRVSESHSIADVLFQLGDVQEAWGTITSCDAMLDQIEGWHEVGLGRSLVETAFKIAAVAPDPTAMEAFRWACYRQSQLETNSQVIFEAAVSAAKKLNQPEQLVFYEAELAQEIASVHSPLEGLEDSAEE